MTRTIEVGALRYTVADDGERRFRVLVSGSVRDAATQALLKGPFEVTADDARLVVKTLAGGRYGLSAHPERVLDVNPLALVITLAAPGYRARAITVTVMPGDPLPVQAPDGVLERLGVRLQGRIAEDAAGFPAVAAARVMVLPAAPGQQPVLLRAPLAADHGAGVEVQGWTLKPATVAGPAKSLDADAPGGSLRVRVNDRQGLAADQILRFGPDLTGELAVIDSVSPEPADLTQPGEVLLKAPTRRSFGKTTALAVLEQDAQVGATRHLAAAVRAGEALLLLDGALATDLLRVNDTPVEYRDLGALSDAEGYYGLDGIAGVGTLNLTVDAAGFTKMRAVAAGVTHTGTPFPLALDPRQPVHLVDFVLSP